MATEVERLVTLLEARISGYEAGLKKAQQQADRAARGIENRFNKMNSTLSGQFVASAKTITTSVGKINGLLGAVGAGVSVGALVSLGRASLELADDLQDTSEQLGISTEALQVFRFAAEESGIEAGKMDQALFKLNTTIGEAAAGDETARKKFRALHIEFQDGQKKVRSTQAVFEDLAVLIAAIPDPVKRSAAAAVLLGDKLGPRFVSLLLKASEGFDKLTASAHGAGQVMGDETIQRLARAQRAIEEFQKRVTIKTGETLEFFMDASDLEEQINLTRQLARVVGQIDALQKDISERKSAGVVTGLDKRELDDLEARLQKLIKLRAEIVSQMPAPSGHSGAGIPKPPKAPDVDLDLSSDDAAKKAKDVLADLQAERDALTQTNKERFVSTALRRADMDATSALGKEIAALAGQLYDEAFAAKAADGAMKNAADLAAQQDEDRRAAIEAGRELIRTQADLDRSFEMELANREELARISGLSARDQEIELLLMQEINAHRAAGLPLLDEEIARKRELIAASVDRTMAIEQEVATMNQLNQWAANGLTDALGQFAESVAAGENAVESLGDSFRSFAADFLKRIAEMIIQETILLALQTITGTVGTGAGGGGGAPGANPASFGGAGGGGGGIFGMLIGSLFHGGGIAGRGKSGRRVPAAAFLGAPRLHGGNVPGLKSDEVAAILQKGEPVISLPQVRKARQAQQSSAGASQQKVEVRNYNLFDEREVVSRAVGTPVGTQAIINVVRGNQAAFRGALGITQSR